jgi:hypothetical protein
VPLPSSHSRWSLPAPNNVEPRPFLGVCEGTQDRIPRDPQHVGEHVDADKAPTVHLGDVNSAPMAEDRKHAPAGLLLRAVAVTSAAADCSGRLHGGPRGLKVDCTGGGLFAAVPVGP